MLRKSKLTKNLKKGDVLYYQPTTVVFTLKFLSYSLIKEYLWVEQFGRKFCIEAKNIIAVDRRP